MEKRTRLPAPDRKKEILKCAVRVFARSNYRSARVADIAREAGVSEAAVYKYFPKKEAIFLEILDYMSRRILTLWEEEFAREEDAIEALKAVGASYYERMMRHPDELKVQFQAISEIDHEIIANRLHRDHESYVAFFTKVIEKGIRQGTIRSDVDVKALAWIFHGLGVLMNMAKILNFENEVNERMISRIGDVVYDMITNKKSVEIGSQPTMERREN
ncbi:MAG: TetR/AcrR family transcriptional regulator [Deltaproteobacteria bacterium]|nr:TetR/AcrR family transcriptional regulator [Deltaproteobacteria bacterium]